MNPIDIECPFCKAPAGRECASTSGRARLYVHSARQVLSGAEPVPTDPQPIVAEWPTTEEVPPVPEPEPVQPILTLVPALEDPVAAAHASWWEKFAKRLNR